MTFHERTRELAHNLAIVQRRIDNACAHASREPRDVHLIAITKTYPSSDVEILAELGVQDFGENRDQEAAVKIAEVRKRYPALTWHFVGQLQRNKARSVASYADVVHCLDRAQLVEAVADGAQRAGRQIGVLIQVNLDDGPATGRGGAAPADVDKLARVAAGTGVLSVLGVMGIAPLGDDPRPAFTTLQRVSQQLRSQFPEAVWVSAGMSGDLEYAIASGATHLRIGSALLGKRA